MLIGNYIFKPQNAEIAEHVIKGFTDHWLNWDVCGAYSIMSTDRCPKGYHRLEVYVEGVAEEFSESCWSGEPVEAADLTNHMFIVLHDQGFFDEDDNGETIFSFEDRELAEVVVALAANNSRVISPWMDDVWIVDKDSNGATSHRRVEMLDYLLQTA